MVIDNFTIIDYLNLATAISVLIPSWILFSHFRRTKIREFMYFAIFFLNSAIVLASIVLANHFDNLIFYKIHWWGFHISFFVLFLHAKSVGHDFLGRKIYWANIFMFSILMILISLWTRMNQPDKTTFFNFNIPRSFSSYYPSGAGLELKGVIIYSTSFHFFGALYHIFVSLIFLIVYMKVKAIHPTEKIMKSLFLWRLAGFLLLLSWVLILPGLVIHPIVKILPLFSGLLVVYISLFLPEGLLISHSQVVNARILYGLLDIAKDKGKGSQFGINSLIEYLESIPQDP